MDDTLCYYKLINIIYVKLRTLLKCAFVFYLYSNNI